MSNTIIHKKSAVAAKVPTTAQLQLGEIALNTRDGNLYFKKDDGTASIVTLKETTGAGSSIESNNLTASRALISDGSGKVAVSAVTSTELGYLDGVTSNIQTQLGSLNASNLTSGIVPNARMSGIYSGLTLKLDGTNTIFTTPSSGSTSPLARTVYNLAEYRSAGTLQEGGGTLQVGAIVFIAPSQVTVMHQLEIAGYLHTSGDNAIDLKVNGYKTSTGWSSVSKLSRGLSNPRVRFGVVDGKSCIILGDVTSVWSYPHIAITKALFSHTALTDEYCYGWTTAVVTDLSAYTFVTEVLDKYPLLPIYPHLGSSTDLNLLTTPGIYTVSSALNSIPTGNNCTVFTIPVDNNKRGQLYFNLPNSPSRAIYYRQSGSDGNYSTWSEFAFKDEVLLNTNDVVANTNLVDMSANTIKGRITTAGDPQDLTAIQVRTLLNVADGANNYTHPANHPASIITQDANNRFVTDTEKSTWGNVNTRNTQNYKDYDFLLDYGNDVAGTWKRLVSVSCVAGSYSTIGFRIEIVEGGTNHAIPTSINASTETYYVACVRTEVTTLNTPDSCYVSGPSNKVRAVKISTGEYEIQIKNYKQYLEYRGRVTVFAVAGSGTHTVNYHNDNGSNGIAQYNASISTSQTDIFQNISVSRSISSYGVVSIASTFPALYLYETDQAVDSKRWMIVCNNSNIYFQTQKDDSTYISNVLTLTRTGNLSVVGDVTATTFSGALTGNATTATTLATSRTLTIGSTGKTFNGSGNVSWSLAEIGAAAETHTNHNKPSNSWTTAHYFLNGNLGGLYTSGGYKVTLTSNGYRNSTTQWESLNVNGTFTGAAVIDLIPDGRIFFRCDDVKATGSGIDPTARLHIQEDYTRIYNQVRNIDGSSTDPAITFSSDLDTGIYRPDTDQVGITAGGERVATFGKTLIDIETKNADFIVRDSSHTPQITNFIWKKNVDKQLCLGSENAVVTFRSNALPSSDNVYNLGSSTQRYKDVYAYEFIAADGSAALPSFSFDGDLDTGIYRRSTNVLAITTGGTEAAYFDASGNTNIVGTLGVNQGTPSTVRAITSQNTGPIESSTEGIRSVTYFTGGAITISGKSTRGIRSLCYSNEEITGAFSYNNYGMESECNAGAGFKGGGTTTFTGILTLARNQSTTGVEVTNVRGGHFRSYVSTANGKITNAEGVRSEVVATIAGSEITNAYLFLGTFGTINGTIINRYGLYINQTCHNFINHLQIGGTEPTGFSNLGLGVGTAATGAGNIDASGIITTKRINETFVNLTTNTINLNLGSLFTRTLSSNATFSVTNIKNGTINLFILELTNGGSHVITWFSNIKWENGIAPTMTVDGRDILVFYTIDNGTTWTGVLIGKDVK